MFELWGNYRRHERDREKDERERKKNRASEVKMERKSGKERGENVKT